MNVADGSEHASGKRNPGIQKRDLEDAGAVQGLVITEGMKLAVVGLVLGFIGAAAASRFIETQLFGVTTGDPLSYFVAVPVLGVAALLACWLPARRATSTSPLEALRAE